MTERGPWIERLEDPVDERAVHRIWRGVEARRRAPSRAGLWIAGGALAAAAALLLWLWPSAPTAAPGPLARAEGGAPLAAGDRVSAAVALSDGSRIAPSEGAQVEVLESTGEAVTAVVGEGRTRFEITPGGPRRWSLECGLARVEVVGTVFTIDREASRVRVAVERGTVLVRSHHLRDGAVRVTAGEQVEVRAPRPESPSVARNVGAPDVEAPDVEAPDVEAPDVEAPDVEAPDVEAPDVEAPDVDPASGTEAATPSIDRAVRPPAATEPVGEPAPRPLSAWLRDADQARAAGDPARAERILVEGLALHPRDRDRGLAWFTLGRVRASRGHDPSAAAQAFDRALAEGAPRALLDEAMTRSVEAHVAAGEHAAARRVADAHRARFPASASRALVDRLAPPVSP